MADEHDDDIAPEVEVGAEIETARFPQVSEDFDEDTEEQTQGAPADDNPAQDQSAEVDYKGDDTI